MNATLDVIAWMPGPWELIVIALFGLLIFGKRLPDVGKSLGKSIVEFKKGLKGIEDDMEEAVNRDQKDMLPPPSPTESHDTPSQQAYAEPSQENQEDLSHTN
jgi:sec-independent protein translocase protein TatA